MTQDVRRIDLGTIPEFTLREADAMECAAGGLTPDMAVRRSVAGSAQAYAQYIDGELVCLWGWRWDSYKNQTIIMWLLSTKAADNHAVAFGRSSKRMLRVMGQRCNHITILVHNRYAVALRWLTWLGFKRARAVTEHFTEMRKVF